MLQLQEILDWVISERIEAQFGFKKYSLYLYL